MSISSIIGPVLKTNSKIYFGAGVVVLALTSCQSPMSQDDGETQLKEAIDAAIARQGASPIPQGTPQVLRKVQSTPNSVFETLAGRIPDSSWKQIGRIEAGATLAVIARIDAERGSVWSVRLPEMGEGWINSNFLRRSTAAEAVAFDKAVVNEEIATIAADAAMIAVSSEPTEPGAVIAEIVEVEMKPAKPTKTPEQIATELRRATFADLEVSWLKIKGQPTADAEVGALYARYVVFAAECANDPSFQARAASRIAQLEVQQEVQNKIFELQATKARLTGECEMIGV